MSISGSRRRWAAAIVAVLALVVVAEAVSPATAGRKIKTRIEIKKLKTSGAKGTLSSSSKQCLSHRKVSLFTWDGYRSQKIAITNSDGKGDWRIRRHLEGGTRYFAKVDGTGRCGYDTSPFESL
jgi:hypothetical protein